MNSGAENKSKIYKGWLDENNFGHLAIYKNIIDGIVATDEIGPLTELIGADFNSGDLVSVRYYILDNEVAETEAKEALIAKILGGSIDVDYKLTAYSEYTIFEFNQDLKIGGHDLIRELGEYVYDNKYVIIEISECRNDYLLQQDRCT